MSSFFRTTEPLLSSEQRRLIRQSIVRTDPWRAALGVLAGVLVVGGAAAVWVGVDQLNHYDGFAVGPNADFDRAFATPIFGGAAIALGILVGTCWLVLGALDWRRAR